MVRTGSVKSSTTKDTKVHEGKLPPSCYFVSFVVFMLGYSGTPLPKKLGIKDGQRVSLVAAPAEVRSELKPSLNACAMLGEQDGDLDFAMLFTKSKADLNKEFTRLARKLAPAGMLWISWPKKSSGVASDLDENVVREIGLAAGLVDVKVCAVTDVWSGLKFVQRLKDR